MLCQLSTESDNRVVRSLKENWLKSSFCGFGVEVDKRHGKWKLFLNTETRKILCTVKTHIVDASYIRFDGPKMTSIGLPYIRRTSFSGAFVDLPKCISGI